MEEKAQFDVDRWVSCQEIINDYLPETIKIIREKFNAADEHDFDVLSVMLVSFLKILIEEIEGDLDEQLLDFAIDHIRQHRPDNTKKQLDLMSEEDVNYFMKKFVNLFQSYFSDSDDFILLMIAGDKNKDSGGIFRNVKVQSTLIESETRDIFKMLSQDKNTWVETLKQDLDEKEEKELH